MGSLENSFRSSLPKHIAKNSQQNVSIKYYGLRFIQLDKKPLNWTDYKLIHTYPCSKKYINSNSKAETSLTNEIEVDDPKILKTSTNADRSRTNLEPRENSKH